MQKKHFAIDMDFELSVDEAKPTLKPMEVIFNGDKFRLDLNREFKIDPYNLVDSMTEHAANYGWWAALLAMSRTRLRKEKASYHQTISGLDKKVRDELVKYEIKITEAAVKAGLESRPEVQRAAQDVAPFEQFVEVAELMLKAFEHKRDMLKEINRAQTSDRLNS